MKHVNIGRFVCALAIASAFTLAACGGNKGSNTTSSMGNQMRTESQREGNALPLNQMARVPRGLRCGATRAVWVNTHTRTFHETGDPYYGRTRNGQYMCPSEALSAGYHLAGSRHSGMMRGAQHGMNNSYDNGATNYTDENSRGRHRHKRHTSSY